MRALVCTAALLCTCTSSVDPDQPGAFACAADADCGAGWECHIQRSGSGRCYRAGTCVDGGCDGDDGGSCATPSDGGAAEDGGGSDAGVDCLPP